MEFHGKVIVVQQVRTGVSQRSGESWYSQDFVLESDGQYTHRCKLSLWGADRIQNANLQLGEYVTAKFEVEAHEFNGDWFNDLRCYDVVANGVSRLRRPQQQRAPQQAPQQQAPQQQAPFQQQVAPGNAPFANQAPAGGYMTQEQIAQMQSQQPDPFRR